MPLRTPLYSWHAAAGARLIEFGGWEMPLQYSGIVEEHLAVRRGVGLFDVSHMGKLLVAGAAAHAFLDELSANDVPTTPGRARYTHLLREDGTTLDDVIITCLSATRFFVVCNAGSRPAVLAWYQAHRPAGVTIDDFTMSHLCLSVQGPRAPELLQRLVSTDLSLVRPFWGAAAALSSHAASPSEVKGWGWSSDDPLMAALGGGAPTSASGGGRFLVTRTGYTGEAGFELFPPAAPGIRLWEALVAAGGDLGLKPVGLGARDTLRLEKGYLLSGQDFTGSQTPLEVNCAWVVKWDRPFVGREALEGQRSRDDYARLVGVRMDDRGIPRHGCAVLAGGAPIGSVTSGTLSPSLRVGVALASVDRAHAAEGTAVDVDIRGVPHPAHVIRLPFL